MSQDQETPDVAGIYEQLLRSGRADVTGLELREVISISERVGWGNAPKIEFDKGKAFMRSPHSRLPRSQSAREARKAQQPAEPS